MATPRKNETQRIGPLIPDRSRDIYGGGERRTRPQTERIERPPIVTQRQRPQAPEPPSEAEIEAVERGRAYERNRPKLGKRVRNLAITGAIIGTGVAGFKGNLADARNAARQTAESVQQARAEDKFNQLHGNMGLLEKTGKLITGQHIPKPSDYYIPPTEKQVSKYVMRHLSFKPKVPLNKDLATHAATGAGIGAGAGILSFLIASKNARKKYGIPSRAPQRREVPGFIKRTINRIRRRP